MNTGYLGGLFGSVVLSATFELVKKIFTQPKCLGYDNFAPTTVDRDARLDHNFDKCSGRIFPLLCSKLQPMGNSPNVQKPIVPCQCTTSVIDDAVDIRRAKDLVFIEDWTRNLRTHRLGPFSSCFSRATRSSFVACSVSKDVFSSLMTGVDASLLTVNRLFKSTSTSLTRVLIRVV